MSKQSKQVKQTKKIKEEQQQLKFVDSIMKGLKHDYKISSARNNQVLKECEIDVLSDKLFQQLYNNLLCFYNEHKKDNIHSQEKKYIFLEIVNILDIIYESKPKYFLNCDFLKSVLIYLIYSIKASTNINLEIALKIFFEFDNIMIDISNKKINKDVCQFEIDIIPTIKALIRKCIGDLEIDLGVFLKKNNLKDIMTYLVKYNEELPFYLKGFIQYYRQDNLKKFLILKIYKYLEIINPFKKADFNFYLYQGYALYEIISYQYTQKINFKAFNDIKMK